MSSNYWQTKKQALQFKHGNTITSKIEAYLNVWEARCYSDGIPDEVPHKLAQSGRVPSYKLIAMAILRNDFTLKSLGFDGKMSDYYLQIKAKQFRTASMQTRLFP